MGILGGSHIFLLEKDLGAMLLQLSDGGQAVDRVACETADRLCENESDATGQGILYHAVKTITSAGRCTGDAFIHVASHFDTIP